MGPAPSPVPHHKKMFSAFHIRLFIAQRLASPTALSLHNRDEKAESDFDRQNASNCFLYVVSRHLVRAGKKLRLLEEPVLSTDPALVEALRILQDLDAYQNIITGRSQPEPPVES